LFNEVLIKNEKIIECIHEKVNMKKTREKKQKNNLMIFNRRLNFKLALFLSIIVALLLKIFLLSRTYGYFISDEAEYSEMSYRIAHDLSLKDYDKRNFLFPSILSFPLIVLSWIDIFKGNLLLQTLKSINLLFSVGCIYLTYFIGKKIFDKKVGLIASLLMTCSSVINYWSLTILTEIPSLFFMLLSLHVFFSDYNKKYLISGFLMALSVTIRFQTFLFLIPFILLFIRRKEIKFLFSFSVVYFIFNGLIEKLIYGSYFNTLKNFLNDLFIQSSDALRYRTTNVFLYRLGLPSFLEFFLKEEMFFIGILLIISVYFVFKNKNKMKKNLLLTLIIIFSFLFFFPLTEERFFIQILPFLYLFSSYALLHITYDFFKKNSTRNFIVIFVLLLLLMLNLNSMRIFDLKPNRGFYQCLEDILRLENKTVLVSSQSWLSNLFYIPSNYALYGQKQRIQIPLNLNPGKNQLVIISNGCDSSKEVEGTRDERCLSYAFDEIKFSNLGGMKVEYNSLETYEKAELKEEDDKDVIWSTNKTVFTFYNPFKDKQNILINSDIFSYYKPRNLLLSFNGENMGEIKLLDKDYAFRKKLEDNKQISPIIFMNIDPIRFDEKEYLKKVIEKSNYIILESKYVNYYYDYIRPNFTFFALHDRFSCFSRDHKKTKHEFQETINLGDENSSKFLGFGWFAPELIEGRYLRFSGILNFSEVNIDLPKQDMTMKIICRSLFFDENTKQYINVSVNGNYLKTLSLKDGWNEFIVHIPKETIKDDDQIIFQYKYTISPYIASGGYINDKGRLAVLFDYIKFY